MTIYKILGFVAAVFAVNVLLLDFFFVAQRNSLLDFQTRLTQLADSFKILGGRLYTTSSGEQKIIPIAEPNNACPVACLDLISLSTSAAKLSTRSLVAPVFPTSTTTTPTSSNKGEFFVPLGTGSVATLNQWVDVNTAQATFDTGTYSAITAIYFEAIMHVAQGEVRARLYDTTTPFIYDGEQVRTTSATGQLVFAQVPLRTGSKTYKVQMYSNISTGFLDQARIRIVTQ